MRAPLCFVRCLVLLVSMLIFSRPNASLLAQCTEKWFVGIGQPGIVANSSPAIEGPVYSSVVWDPDGNGPQRPLLVLGGDFHPGVGSSFNRLAAWDGSTWYHIGGGVTGGPVLALYVLNNDLIVGGRFTHAGGIPASYVARWNGSTWSNFGSGLSGGDSVLSSERGVRSFAVYNGNLVAGGNFRFSGSTALQDIAIWNGLQWNPLGPVAPNYSSLWVKDITYYQNNLIIARGGGSGPGVARYNPVSNNFVSVGIPAGQYVAVNSLSIFGGELIAAGHFTQIGTSAVQKIARWNGNSWQAMGADWSGSASPIYDTVVREGKLYAVGHHYGLDHVGQWDEGTGSWVPLGLGVNSTVFTATPFNGDLIVGGYLTSAGSSTARRVANWGCGGPQLHDLNPKLSPGWVGDITSFIPLSPEAIINWSSSALQALSRPVSAAAADGVTRLLVKMRVPNGNPVQVSVQNELGGSTDVGRLAPVGQTPSSTNLQIQPVQVGNHWYVFANYQVPDEFMRTVADLALDYRLAWISVTRGTVTESFPLRIVRPPVLLLHGAFDPPAKTWDYELFNDSRYFFYPALGNFDREQSFNYNKWVTQTQVDAALASFRSRGYAASQVTFVGFDSGAILGRQHAAGVAGNYYRYGNLGQGDFDKYISWYGPHLGSGLACVAQNHASNSFWQSIFVSRYGFNPANPVFTDMRPDSAAIAGLSGFQGVPSHTIVGNGGPLKLLEVLDLGGPPSSVPSGKHAFRKSVVLPAILLLLGSQYAYASISHDVVVSDLSAAGGLPFPQSLTLGWTQYGSASTHFESTYSSDVFNFPLLPLIDAPKTLPVFADGMAANASVPVPLACSQPAPIPLVGSTSGGLQITSPSPNTIVQAGATVSVDFLPTGQFQPAFVFIEGDFATGFLGQPPSSLQIPIPADAIGPKSLRIVGLDQNLEVAITADFTLQVSNTASMTGVRAVPNYVQVGFPSDQVSLLVYADFTGGLSQDITAAATGTTYVSADPSKVVVDPDGVLTAVAPGSTVITVIHGGFQTEVTAHVKVCNPPMGSSTGQNCI